MGALIFPRLTRITSCFAASVARSGVTPLILRASNTTTRFSSRSSNFCNFIPRIHQKRSQKVRNPNFVCVCVCVCVWGGGGACPQTPLAGALRALIAYWKPPFQNCRSATALPHGSHSASQLQSKRGVSCYRS